jgi:hypothetical protein
MTTRTFDHDGFSSLAAEFIGLFDAWDSRAHHWADSRFDELSRRAFEVQYEGNVSYRKYCDARGVTPSDVSCWRDPPCVPTGAFRVVDLIVGRTTDARLEFRTSGTTGGSAGRGRHLVREPALYRASLRSAFRNLVIPDKKPRNIITLLPAFTYLPDSSLGWMLKDIREALGGPLSESVATPGGIDWGRLEAVLRAAAAEAPVLIMGTTLAFAEWWSRLESGACAAPALPVGSILVDTGGTKGRAGVDRPVMMRKLRTRLNVPDGGVVSEFGMTELLSQRYARGDHPGPFAGPPWLRTRVLDPVTLDEVPVGKPGILCHFDLANLGSVCAVLTEDLGRARGDEIELIGRSAGAPPRGCSLSTAEILEAQRNA